MSERQGSRQPRARRCWAWVLTVALGGLIVSVPRTAPADEPDAAHIQFFETEIRPLLAENCVKCHGPDKQKGGLRLDSRSGILQGGDTGPAVVPGAVDESLIVEAINYDLLQMPPTGQLPAEKRAKLVRWIEMGAPWPATDAQVAVSTASARTITDEDRAFWSFQPLRRPDPPTLSDQGWGRNPIDRFILARLIEEGMTPAPEADRRALIRRVYFDLWGLPPTPEEVEAFVRDDDPEAYEHLVDRLLASPRYGERWGRHWLDLVRYAESDGYRQDAYRPDAWRYRDYVIRSFNEDKPYDRFVTEQLAGDEWNPDDPEMRTAVSYLRLGTYEFNQRDVPGQWSAILNDITDVTADVFLGMGMGCARCHDHKFDPILQKDYFRLQAFFTPIRLRDDLPLATPEREADYYVRLAAWELMTADLRARIAEVERPHREAAAKGAIEKFPAEIQALLATPAAELSPQERQLAELAYRQVTYEYDHLKVGGKDKERWETLKKELAEFDRYKPDPLPGILTATDLGPDVPPTIIPGDRKGEHIAPGFLTVLEGPEPAEIAPVPNAPDSTGRRLTLARWLTRPDHPLTSRVMVNRIWQYHFGKGLVATPSDFGRLGEPPSHPALLDWLATEFVTRGWSLKAIHRLILTSATYRQTALRPARRPGRADRSRKTACSGGRTPGGWMSSRSATPCWPSAASWTARPAGRASRPSSRAGRSIRR